MRITRADAIAQKLPGSDTIRSDHFTYLDDLHRAWGAVLLNREALKAFNDTVVIGRRRELEEHRERVRGWIAAGAISAGLPYPQSEWSHAASEYQNYEFLKLGVGVELHLKARLLERGFAVHRVDHNVEQFKRLARDQQQRPIPLDELRAIDDWRFDGVENYLPGLLRDSIKLSWMTSKANYRKALAMPEDLLDLAERLRQLRNRIHLPIGGYFARIDPDGESEYVELLVSLVNGQIVDQANRLILAYNLAFQELSPVPAKPS